MGFTVGGFHVGMHAKAADDDPFGGFAKQVVVVIWFLRGCCEAALVVRLNAALLTFGEFIFTQSC